MRFTALTTLTYTVDAAWKPSMRDDESVLDVSLAVSLM
jgi:hypothetical protein